MQSIRAVGVLVAVALSACEQDVERMDFRIEFESTTLSSRAVLIEAAIRQGGCDGEQTLYVSRFEPDVAGPTPSELSAGRYGFVARAQDEDCMWYADGCTEVVLPDGAARPLVVHVSQSGTAMLDCDSETCSAAACAPPDASGMNGDATMPNVDAAVDAAVDAGAPAQVVQIVIEAESADPLLEPLMRFDDPTASGGAYVSAPYDPMLSLPERYSMMRGETPLDDADGVAVYDFELPTAGMFRLWGRIITPTLDEDSFWIRIDDDSWLLWNDIAHFDAWNWVDVRPFERRVEPFIVPLGAGPHRLRVSYRELGPKLDKLMLTTDIGLVPDG